jgi:4-hydroxybenzoate polyprenyltransferase
MLVYIGSLISVVGIVVAAYVAVRCIEIAQREKTARATAALAVVVAVGSVVGIAMIAYTWHSMFESARDAVTNDLLRHSAQTF